MNNVFALTSSDATLLIDPLVTFDNFWMLVVKKARKYETRLEWNRLEDEEKVAALVGAAQWRRVWLKMEQTYIVDPCRWVKYRRWEDELPADIRVSAASHIPFAGSPDEPPAKRTELPEQVRLMLRKLTGRA